MSGTDTTGKLRPVFDRLEQWVAGGEVAGLGIAVGSRGLKVADWYAGEAAADLPSGPEVLWPLASISKLYTAAVVLALVEQGELALSTTVRGVLPEFEGGGREQITVRHLLTHSSGMAYESPKMESLLRQRTPLDTLVDDALAQPLDFEPGTRFGYSDFGYAVLARLAATVTGRPFPELVRRHVLQPGELRDTFMPAPASEHGRVAQVDGAPAYGTDGDLYNSPYGRGLGHPAFGAVATVDDLLQFGLLFTPNAKHRILADATVRAMTTDQTGGELKGSLVGRPLHNAQAWGLGFQVRGRSAELGMGELASPQSFGHPGASGCVLWIDPAEDLTIAFVSNRHINTGFERVFNRLSVVINKTLVALTDRTGRSHRQIGFG